MGAEGINEVPVFMPFMFCLPGVVSTGCSGSGIFPHGCFFSHLKDFSLMFSSVDMRTKQKKRDSDFGPYEEN